MISREHFVLRTELDPLHLSKYLADTGIVCTSSVYQRLFYVTSTSHVHVCMYGGCMRTTSSRPIKDFLLTNVYVLNDHILCCRYDGPCSSGGQKWALTGVLHANMCAFMYTFTEKHACFLVLLQLVLTFDPHWKRVHCVYVYIMVCHANRRSDSHGMDHACTCMEGVQWILWLYGTALHHTYIMPSLMQRPTPRS